LRTCRSRNIAGGLGRSYDEVTWILTTYLVANAVSFPCRHGSRVDRAQELLHAVRGAVHGTSLLCGIAPSLEVMLFARVLQGIGAAVSLRRAGHPGGYISGHKRASAFALYTVAIVTAPAIGPVLGGWITDNYNWRWVFLITLPIGLLSMYLTNRFVHDPPSLIEDANWCVTTGAGCAWTA